MKLHNPKRKFSTYILGLIIGSSTLVSCGTSNSVVSSDGIYGEETPKKEVVQVVQKQKTNEQKENTFTKELNRLENENEQNEIITDVDSYQSEEYIEEAPKTQIDNNHGWGEPIRDRRDSNVTISINTFPRYGYYNSYYDSYYDYGYYRPMRYRYGNYGYGYSPYWEDWNTGFYGYYNHPYRYYRNRFYYGNRYRPIYRSNPNRRGYRVANSRRSYRARKFRRNLNGYRRSSTRGSKVYKRGNSSTRTRRSTSTRRSTRSNSRAKSNTPSSRTRTSRSSETRSSNKSYIPSRSSSRSTGSTRRRSRR